MREREVADELSGGSSAVSDGRQRTDAGNGGGNAGGSTSALTGKECVKVYD
ncbi:hypothetical protein Hanom_Chr04g00339361 [Helianthus anomalus]